jgi:predicted transcriptional regulator
MIGKQKEALIIALAEKEKTYREIAKEAGVSPNTIKAVLNKAGLDESTSMSSRAFELYVKQKTPVEVAIELNLEADKAIQYYHDYFRLLGITEFTKVYRQIKDNPWPFVNLVKLGQNSKIGEDEVIELLKIANGILPRVRLEYNRVKGELDSLEANKLNSFKEYQRQCNEITNPNKEISWLQSVVGKLRREEARLNQQKERTEYFVKMLRNNSEACVKLKQMVKQRIESSIVQQPRHLIRIAIASILESERKNPGKLRSLYYNTTPNLSVEQLLSKSPIIENQSDPARFSYSNDSLENLIMEEAEQCYNRLVEAYADKCINDIPYDAESLAPAYNVPSIQHEMSRDNGYSDHERPKVEEYLTKLYGNSAYSDNL